MFHFLYFPSFGLIAFAQKTQRLIAIFAFEKLVSCNYWILESLALILVQSLPMMPFSLLFAGGLQFSIRQMMSGKMVEFGGCSASQITVHVTDYFIYGYYIINLRKSWKVESLPNAGLIFLLNSQKFVKNERKPGLIIWNTRNSAAGVRRLSLINRAGQDNPYT